MKLNQLTILKMELVSVTDWDIRLVILKDLQTTLHLNQFNFPGNTWNKFKH